MYICYIIYIVIKIYFTLLSFISYPEDLIPLLQLVQVSAVVLVDAPSVLCTHVIVQLHVP